MFEPASKIIFEKSKLSGSTNWLSPSNIALIKYWGKKDLQTPINPSLSFTLKQCYTETSVSYKPSKSRFKYEFLFEGKSKPHFKKN